MICEVRMEDVMDRQMHALKEVVEERCGCLCRHAGSAHVCEKGEDGATWEGEVHRFELVGHPKAQVCYAFVVGLGEGKCQQVTALGPPIKSPEWAVRIYLMRERMKAKLAASLSAADQNSGSAETPAH
ncbi:MAG: hypothetical protein ACTHN5_22035 [Phycisphaerae bacterium]